MTVMTMSIEMMLQRQIENRARLLLEQFSRKTALSGNDWEAIYRALEMALSAPKGWPQAKSIFDQLLVHATVLERGQRWMLLLMHGIEVSAGTGDNRTQADLLLELGRCYDQLSEFEKAEESFLHSAALYRQIDRITSQAVALNHAASMAYRLQRYAQAQGLVDTALKISDDAPEALGHAYLVTGALRWAEGSDATLAIGDFRLALEYAIHAQDQLTVAKAYSNLGVAYRMAEDWKSAEAVYQEAIHYASSINDDLHVAIFNANIGVVYFKQDDLEKALIHYERALPSLKKLGNTEYLAPLYNNIGMLYVQLRQPAAARQNFNASAELWRMIGNDVAYENVISNLSLMDNETQDEVTDE